MKTGRKSWPFLPFFFFFFGGGGGEASYLSLGLVFNEVALFLPPPIIVVLTNNALISQVIRAYQKLL